MPEFVLHILKMNLIAAVILLLTELFSRLSRGRYASGWKYWVWFAVAVFLLVPVKLPSGRLPQLTVNFVVEQPVKTADSNLLAAQKEAEVSQQTSAQTVQQTFHSHEIQLKETPFGFTFDQLLRLFGEIWLAGALFLGLVGLARYYLALHRLYRWSLPVDDEDILKDYQRLSREAELKKPPKLLKNDRLTTPVLAGLFHPAVYLTNERYEKQELCFILSHELTHYQRRDLWYKLLMQAVVSSYWFNPFLYKMRRDAERTVENLCDARVVGGLSSQEQLSYSRLLLKTAAKQSRVPYLAAGLNDGILVFKERIRCMRNLSAMKRCRFPAVLLCAVMLLAQLLIGEQRGGGKQSPSRTLLRRRRKPDRKARGWKLLKRAKTVHSHQLRLQIPPSHSPSTAPKATVPTTSMKAATAPGRTAAEEPIPITETASGSATGIEVPGRRKDLRTPQIRP